MPMLPMVPTASAAASRSHAYADSISALGLVPAAFAFIGFVPGKIWDAS
jgi:hypothetical protein